MSCIRAKDIMHPRVSLQAKEKGLELVKKLMCGYPGLPEETILCGHEKGLNGNRYRGLEICRIRG